MEGVNVALADLEERDRVVASERVNIEKHSDIQKTPSRTSSGVASVNGKSVANGAEENGKLHDEIVAESESDSDSGTIERLGDDEEHHDEESEGDDDYDDGAGHASDEEDEVHVRQKVPKVDPQEVADFDRELRALMQESLDSRKLELRARPTLNMMIPMNLFEGPTKDHHGKGIEGESGDETTDDGAGGYKEVRVKVLVKKGNKQQTKQMYIPQDCSLVQSTKQKEAAELEEKQDIKRLVLEYNNREEEELNGFGTQPQSWAQSSGGRVIYKGHLWEGHSRSSSGSRYRHHHSGGTHYSRRR